MVIAHPYHVASFVNFLQFHFLANCVLHSVFYMSWLIKTLVDDFVH
jgi:hypothetical protein